LIDKREYGFSTGSERPVSRHDVPLKADALCGTTSPVSCSARLAPLAFPIARHAHYSAKTSANSFVMQMGCSPIPRCSATVI